MCAKYGKTFLKAGRWVATTKPCLTVATATKIFLFLIDSGYVLTVVPKTLPKTFCRLGYPRLDTR